MILKEQALTYKSIIRALLIWLLFGATIVHAQALSTLPGTSCAGCNSIVVRGTGGVQQQTQGQTQISGIAVTWSLPAIVRTIMIFDQGTVPPNGGVSPSYCYVINGTQGPAMGTITLDWTVHPYKTLQGCVIAISTNAAGCAALTLDTPSNRIDLQAQSP